MRGYDRCFVKWWVLNCRVELLFLVELSCRVVLDCCVLWNHRVVSFHIGLVRRVGQSYWTVVSNCPVVPNRRAHVKLFCQTVVPNCRAKLSC